MKAHVAIFVLHFFKWKYMEKQNYKLTECIYIYLGTIAVWFLNY